MLSVVLIQIKHPTSKIKHPFTSFQIAQILVQKFQSAGCPGMFVSTPLNERPGQLCRSLSGVEMTDHQGCSFRLRSTNRPPIAGVVIQEVISNHLLNCLRSFSFREIRLICGARDSNTRAWLSESRIPRIGRIPQIEMNENFYLSTIICFRNCLG